MTNSSAINERIQEKTNNWCLRHPTVETRAGNEGSVIEKAPIRVLYTPHSGLEWSLMIL